MDKIFENGVLNPNFTTKVFQSTIDRLSPAYVGERFLPVVSQQDPVVKIMRYEMSAGLMDPVAPDAESPIVESEGFSLKAYTPIEFRNKYAVSHDDVLRLIQQQENTETVAQVLSKYFARLARKASDRVEDMRWKALQGTLTINQNGINVPVDYELDGAFQETLAGAAQWTAAATATPLDDISRWVRTFSDSTGGYTADDGVLVMNQRTAEVLLQTDQVNTQGIVTNTALQNGLDNVRRRLFVGQDLEFVVYDKGYVAVNGSTTKTKFIADGDVYIIGASDMGTQIGEVTATPSPYPSAANPTTGYFSDSIEKADPRVTYIRGGIRALPALYSDKAVFYANVF